MPLRASINIINYYVIGLYYSVLQLCSNDVRRYPRAVVNGIAKKRTCTGTVNSLHPIIPVYCSDIYTDQWNKLSSKISVIEVAVLL